MAESSASRASTRNKSAQKLRISLFTAGEGFEPGGHRTLGRSRARIQKLAKAPRIRAYLGSATAPPRMPETLSSAQAELDDGLWAAARTALLETAAADSVDKITKGWAKGVAAWIDLRGTAVFEAWIQGRTT